MDTASWFLTKWEFAQTKNAISAEGVWSAKWKWWFLLNKNRRVSSLSFCWRIANGLCPIYSVFISLVMDSKTVNLKNAEKGLRTTVSGLAKVAIFTTNVDAENQFWLTTNVSAEYWTATFAKPVLAVRCSFLSSCVALFYWCLGALACWLFWFF